ncbi:creatininase family protein [Rhizobium sp. SSA_523]|uniref:creatininase family protein n=1 Tax=Rhizobium sp. SSA_523 TaxID=2952477 RepID=UPI0020912803|nr:creatininase family protein [Rhizobium sp. SSA_523]MCO5731578.1 creatininase family protein [Rhizobium sp. SSA_523]WKC21907.1 creatininase family protein [Rhizobium sp. SSA_523]
MADVEQVAISRMTHEMFAERMKRPAVILIPLASQEEQGPHAPMGDFMLTERLAEMSARRGAGLMAPVLPFGHAEFFRGIAGGIQLRAATFTAVLEDILTSFLDHGHERLLIFNGHTTNAPLIDQVCRKLRLEKGVLIPALNIWQSLPESLWNRLYADGAARVRGHGGEPMTSVYMHLFPDLVREGAMRDPAPRGTVFGLPIGGVSATRFEGLPVQIPLDCTEVDPSGMLGGLASLASAEKGEVIVDHIVSHTARLMRHLAGFDPRHAVQPFGAADEEPSQGDRHD